MPTLLFSCVNTKINAWDFPLLPLLLPCILLLFSDFLIVPLWISHPLLSRRTENPTSSYKSFSYPPGFPHPHLSYRAALVTSVLYEVCVYVHTFGYFECICRLCVASSSWVCVCVRGITSTLRTWICLNQIQESLHYRNEWNIMVKVFRSQGRTTNKQQWKWQLNTPQIFTSNSCKHVSTSSKLWRCKNEFYKMTWC